MNRRGFLGMFGVAAGVAAVPAAVLATPAAAPQKLRPINLTIRAEKGLPLTFKEVDDNFLRIAERIHKLEGHR